MTMKIALMCLLFGLPAQARQTPAVSFSSSLAVVEAVKVVAATSSVLQVFDARPALPPLDVSPASVAQEQEAAIGVPAALRTAEPKIEPEELQALAEPEPFEDIKPRRFFLDSIELATDEPVRMEVKDQKDRRLASFRKTKKAVWRPEEPGFYYVELIGSQGPGQASFTVPGTAKFDRKGGACFRLLPDRAAPELAREIRLAVWAHFEKPAFKRVIYSIPTTLGREGQAAIAALAKVVAAQSGAALSQGPSQAVAWAEIRLEQ